MRHQKLNIAHLWSDVLRFTARTVALNGLFQILALLAVLAGLCAPSPAKAYHWATTLPGNQTQTCASGPACAIAQYQAFYGTYPGGYCLQLGGSANGDWDCGAHPNPSNPPYALNGYASLVCDAGEVMGPEGCAMPLGKSRPERATLVADPVNVMEGVVYEAITDYTTLGQDPLKFTRYFWTDRSTGYGPERPSRLGGGWRSNFDVKIAFIGSSESPTDIFFATYNGETLHFQPRTDSQGKTYYIEIARYAGSNNDYPALGTPLQHLTSYNFNGTTFSYTLVDEHDISYTFAVVSSSAGNSAQLQTITYRDGYQQTLNWTNGVNTSITDNLGRSLSFGYDSSGNMTSMTTSDGQVFTYTYADTNPTAGSNIDLNSIQFTSNYSFLLQSVTYPGPNQPTITYQYNNSQFPFALTGIIDQRGIQTSSWTYDSDGRVSQNGRAGGLRQYNFSYDTTNNKTTVTNPLGAQIIYSYNPNALGQNLLTQVQGVASGTYAGGTTTYTYDANNYVNQVTDGEGRVTTYVNNSSGQKVSITKGAGTAQATTTTLTWHPTFNVPTQIVEPNLTTALTWNASGQLAQVTQTDTTTQTVPFSTAGRTRTWSYTYGTGGLLASVDGPLAGTGDTVSYTYNATGFLQTVTDQLGHVTTVTAWNGRGQPTSVTGINNVVTTYGYDPLGRLTSIIVNPGSSQTTWSMTYTLAGDLATVTQPTGATYTLTRDNARRLTTITNALGETINYTRNVLGKVTGKTIKAADGSTIVYQVNNSFDAIGRLIKQVGGANSSWSSAFDRSNLATSITDPRGKVIGLGYDAVARLINETERDGSVVSHSYNAKGEETTYTDPKNLATTYVRDGFGDIIQETSPDRGVTICDYDARGLMISRKDARNVQTTYAYDNAGRLTSVSYPANPSLNVAYTYDGAGAGSNGIGHVTHIADAAGTTNYTYDAAGRITSETRTIGGVPLVVRYSWDPAGSGELVGLTLPSGFALNYSYDALGRPATIGLASTAAGPFSTIIGNLTYFPYGGLQQINFANGFGRYQSDDLEYRPNGLFLTKGSTALINRFFSFGDNLNLTEINNNAVDSSQTQDFNYDDAQHLTYASGSYGSRFWQYDQAANRLSEAKTVAGTTTNQTYVYPPASNQLSFITQGSATVRAFSYDAAGNTIQDNRSGTIYSYTVNAAGRIAQLKIGGVVTATYSYDAKGRLSVRTTANMSPAGTTHYIYDIADHLLAETDGVGNIQKEYLWLGDEPVAVGDWTITPGSPLLLYIHADHLHRPEFMTDTSGNVVWQASYEPFGTVSTITGSVTENRRFPGQVFQLEAGLSDNWHRHYDSTLGRYTSADPLGVRLAGPNVYAYARLNPLVVTDRSGLDPSGPGNVGAGSDANGPPGGGGNDDGANDDGAVTPGGGDATETIDQGYVAAAEPSIFGVLGMTVITEGVSIIVSGILDPTPTAANDTPDKLPNPPPSPYQLGLTGEMAVRSVYDIGPKQTIDVNGVARIPDGLTENTLTEVKNVGYQSYTQQIADDVTFTQQRGFTFNLFVRQSTQVSSTLQNAFDTGIINRMTIPGSK